MSLDEMKSGQTLEERTIGAVFRRGILAGEKCLTVISLPNNGRSTMLRRICYQPENYGEKFEKEMKKQSWVVVSIPADLDLAETVEESPYYKVKDNGLKRNFWGMMGRLLDGDGEKLVWIVNSIDSVDNEARQKKWRMIRDTYYRYPGKVALVVGQGWEEVTGVREMLGELWPYYQKNRFYLGLRSREEMEEFWKKGEGEERERYIEWSGGYLPLMRRFLELESLPKSIEEVLEDEVVDYSLNLLWESCSEGSRGYLINLARGIKGGGAADYLTETGVVRGREFFSPLWARWLLKMLTERGITIGEVGGKLKLDGEADLEEVLSFQEYGVLKLLWQNRNQLVSREQIGEELWGKKAEENFSDWALDQVMSKLRRKLGDIGIERKIKTVRGKGFRLEA